MKKVKLFFAATTLMLLTVGVFAFKTKVVDTGVYYYDAPTATFVQIAGDPQGVLSTAQTNNASVTGTASKPIYTFDGTNFNRLKLPF